MILRKTIAFLFFSFHLIFSFFSYANQTTFPFLGEVSNDKVNVRAGQNENFEKICQLTKGEQVIVLEESYGWYKIKMPKVAGVYISDKYVRPLTDQSAEVVGDRINLRAGPDVNRTIVGQVANGMQLSVLEKLEGWYKVQPVDNSYAWVTSQFITFKSNDIAQLVEVKTDVAAEVVVEDQSSEVSTTIVSQSVLIQEKVEVASQPISVIGILEPYQDEKSDKTFHRLMINNDPAYYIQGIRSLLDEFLYYRVSIQGTLKTGQEIVPTIVVSKIQLVL